MKFTKKRGAAVLAACAVMAGGAGVAIAGGSPLLGGSSDRAQNLAEALNETAGTSVTPDQVEQALEGLREERLQEAIDSGQITQEQADAKAAHREFREASSEATRTAVEELLGKSIDEVQAAVADGTSVAEQAEAAGKTRQDAVDAIAGAITSARDSAPDDVKEKLTDERITEMAERTADADGAFRGGRRGGGHHGGGHRGEFGGGKSGKFGGERQGAPAAPSAPEADEQAG